MELLSGMNTLVLLTERPKCFLSWKPLDLQGSWLKLLCDECRSSMQLAWDFVTVSKKNSLGNLEWMRDDALQRAEQQNFPYKSMKGA